MSSRRPFTTLLLATALLLLVLSAPEQRFGALAEDGELERLRAELNVTQRQLEVVTEERDDYAQRLEDQTVILVIVLVMLIISYIIFYLANRRYKVLFREFQAKAGVELATLEPKKRPKRRRG